MTLAYTPGITAPPEQEIDYPVRDGKPVGETDAHVDLTLIGKDVLRNYFRDRPDVYVSGNNFIYYEKGNIKARVSPDGYIVFGVQMRQRDSYKVWEEGGKLPAVVFEYTSRSTKKEDQHDKRILYEQVLRVPEYFLFDPKGDYLRPRLQGYRLTDGRYLPLLLEDSRLYSEQLDLYLVIENNTMRFFNPHTGENLRTLAEESDARRAEAERAAREAERAAREAERAAREAERAAREAERAAFAEAEILRLTAELEALRGRAS